MALAKRTALTYSDKRWPRSSASLSRYCFSEGFMRIMYRTSLFSGFIVASCYPYNTFSRHLQANNKGGHPRKHFVYIRMARNRNEFKGELPISGLAISMPSEVAVACQQNHTTEEGSYL